MNPDRLPNNVISLVDRSLPPHALDAEISVLGGILLDENAIARVADTLNPEHFYLTSHQKVYRVMLDLYKADARTDLISVAQLLRDRNQLDDIGGAPAIASLIDAVVSAINIDAHADLIVEKAKRRALIQTCRDLMAAANDGAIAWADLQAKAESEVFNLSAAATQKGLTSLSDILGGELDRIDAAQRGELPLGILSGFYDLDLLTQGFKRHQLIVAGGRPGMGKSVFASSIARNIAAQNLPVALFSLEMGQGEVARRLLSSESGVEAQRIDSGKLADRELEQVLDAMAPLTDLPFFIDESESVTPSSVMSQCRKLKAQHGELGMVIVDYLHLMLDGGDDEVRELGKLTRAFKRMTRSLNAPILLLSQLSRAVEGRSDKRPNLGDLRQSGSIEQDADMVLFLYRDEYYRPDTPDRGITEVSIAKHRGGPTGTVKLLFTPECVRFRNLSRGGY